MTTDAAESAQRNAENVTKNAAVNVLVLNFNFVTPLYRRSLLHRYNGPEQIARRRANPSISMLEYSPAFPICNRSTAISIPILTSNNVASNNAIKPAKDQQGTPDLDVDLLGREPRIKCLSS